jgi:NADH-quinone oxidoreductase subunit J
MIDAFIVFFAVVAVVFAGLVLTLRQPMRAALALIAHMISLAAIFACLSVHVIALFQLLIYVGAVMVFMVYDHAWRARRRLSRVVVPWVAGIVAVALP